MKRVIPMVFFALVLLFHSEPTYAAGIQIQIDGITIPSDVEPEIKNNRTMVPLRIISEVLGADVAWSPSETTLIKDNTHVIFKPGSNTILKDGKSVLLDVEPYVKNNRTMVPLRFFAETFGYKVHYSNYTVTLQSDPLVLDDVAVNMMQLEQHMTNSATISQFEGNAFLTTLYDLFVANKGDEVDAPVHYSWMYNYDILGWYSAIGQYDFLDLKGNNLLRYQIYMLAGGIPGESYEGYAEALLFDATDEKWYIFSRAANDTILDYIEVAKNNGFMTNQYGK